MLNYSPVHTIYQSVNGTQILEVKTDSLDTHFALKLIGPLSSPIYQMIFERENSALRALNAYDEIVHILRVEKNITYDNRNDYGGILLELVDGQSLDKEDIASFPEAKRLNICLQIARGIAHAHDNGIIHRDIKPSNIMLTTTDKIKIIDFGSSKNKLLVERETLQHFYSPLYSAPEVLSSGVADEISDIYSIGAVFYWIFFGEDPKKTSSELFEHINNAVIRERLRVLLLRMLEPDHEKRLYDLNSIITELQCLMGNLTYAHNKYVFHVNSGILSALKRINFIEKATTMSQLVSSILPLNFSELYGTYTRDRDVYCFIGGKLAFESTYSTADNMFVITDIQECILSKSIKLKKIYTRIEGVVKFCTSAPYPGDAYDNHHLGIILKNYSTDACVAQRKEELFDDLFGKWELSIDESIDSIKNRNAYICYSEYEIHNHVLTLFSSSYENRDADVDLTETEYIIEEVNGKHSRVHKIGLFDSIQYDNDGNMDININLHHDAHVFVIRQLLSQHRPVHENYRYKTKSYERQLYALHCLKKEQYNSLGLKDIFLEMAVPGTVPQIKDLEINPMLDRFQCQAVNKALCAEPISLIQGPPGTGKTQVIGEILRQIYIQGQDNPSGIKVLVVSQSHTAVDNVLENIKQWIDSERIRTIRIGDNRKVSDVIAKSYTIDATRDQIFRSVTTNAAGYIAEKIATYKAISKTPHGAAQLKRWENAATISQEWIDRCSSNDNIDYQLISSSSIIAGTCIGFLSNKYILDMCFDYVIVDEAAKATTPELLVSIIKAQKIILVGDQNQLPPYADEELSKTAAQLVRDPKYRLFDLLFHSLPDSNKQILQIQYRMIQNIGDMISSVFYDSTISTGIDDSKRQHKIPWLDGVSIVWYSTSKLSMHEQRKQVGNSYLNMAENMAIKYLLRQFDSLDNSAALDIGIITGYRAQRDQIVRSIASANYSQMSRPIIDTLDAFQGRQNDIIIYSTVRTEKTIGFQKEKERMNVAFSRAKCLLIVCGDLDFFYSWDGSENKYVEIIDYIKRNSQTCKIIELVDGEML